MKMVLNSLVLTCPITKINPLMVFMEIMGSTILNLNLLSMSILDFLGSWHSFYGNYHYCLLYN